MILEINNNQKVSDREKIFQDTLKLLEWPRLCRHVATFASTKQGRNNCERFLLPDNFPASCRRLAETLEMFALDAEIEGGVSFAGISDLSETLLLCKKGGVASGEDLLKVANTLASARRIRRLVDNVELRPITTELLKDLVTLPDLEKLLKFGLEEGGRVANRASTKLEDLRRQSHGCRMERNQRIQSLLKRYHLLLQDTVISERHDRPVLAFKTGSSSQVNGTVYDSSASGNTIFVEPQEIIPLGNRIAQIDAHIREEEQRLLKVWSSIVADNFLDLNDLGKILLSLDLALARARYGNWLEGVAPNIKEDSQSPFTFKDLRHPLLIWQERYEGGSSVVPVTIEVTSNLRVVAITGPNTGGKTVTLKSFGLAVLMARAGLLIPCSGSPSLPWCQQVLADIGDEQSLQQNLSTFSSHITRISTILKAISANKGTSLVLLDEVGAGTDPTEGGALATALLRTLADKARLTIATTHFGELKTLKYNDSRFENASVAFDSETMAPTYRLQWGIPGSSNAISIAQRLGLDPEIIQMAHDLVGPTAAEELNRIIRGLEDQRERQQFAAEEAAVLLARAELLHDELIKNWNKQCQKSEEFQEQGRKKLRTSISEGQKEVRGLIRRLRDKTADGETARVAGQRLRFLNDQNYSNSSKPNHSIWLPKVGEKIRVLNLGKSGEIISISEDGTQITVACGIFRTKVSISEIETLDGVKPGLNDQLIRVNTPSSRGISCSQKTSKNTVDVRGLRVHEAEAVVEEYLRKVHGPIWVVHGVGSGRLKKGLRDWLNTVPYVEKVLDADPSEGGLGCSVIWLVE